MVANIQVQKVCLWCGLIAIVVFGIGLWPIAGLIPPPSPDDSPREIQAFYADNPDAIRIGLLVVMVAGGLTGPWVAMISQQMRRMTGPDSPLANLQLGVGMLGIMVFILPAMIMQAVAFRPTRDPDLLVLANDMAWLPFVGIFVLVFIQNIAIAAAIFQDREERVLPRWLAYFNIWIALLYVPAGFVFFFKDGPFAWNGLITFYLPAVAFGMWFCVMFPFLKRAIESEARELEAVAAGYGPAGQVSAG